MRSWWRPLALLAALALPASLGLAQENGAQTYEDFKLLSTMQKLALTPAQMQKLAAAEQTLRQMRQAVADARAATWEQHQADIDAVNGAWVKGERALSSRKRAANEAIERVQKVERALAQEEAQVAVALRADLSREQKRVVETAQQAQLRRQRQERLSGAATVGEYVAGELDRMRDLMEDEYRLLRAAEARRMAENILGPDAGDLDQLAGAVLAIMDQVMSWSAQRFGEQRESLPAQISESLGIREQQPSAGMVKYEEFIALVSSERTAAVLGSCLRARQTTVEEEQAPVGGPVLPKDDELSQAMARADCLNFFNSLGVETSQLKRMAPPLKAIQSYLGQRESDRELKLTRLSAEYQRACELLIPGDKLPDEVAQKLAAAEQEMAAADLEMKRAIHGQMEALAKIFYPAQNEQLDWTAPAEIVPPESAEQRATRERQISALINEAGRLLERVRYLPPHDYVTARIGIVADYVGRYFNPNLAAFDEVHALVMECTSEVRMLEEEVWQQDAALYAERMVRLLGLMPGRPEPAPTAVTWHQLYALLTNPQTLKAVQDMLEVR